MNAVPSTFNPYLFCHEPRALSIAVP